MIIYGALRGSTNAYYGGAGTSIATVAGGLTLGMVRKIAKNLQANHGKPVNKVLKSGPNFGTDPVAEGYTVYCHTDWSRTSATCRTSCRRRRMPVARRCRTKSASASGSGSSPRRIFPRSRTAARPSVRRGCIPRLASRSTLPVHRGGAGRVGPDRAAWQGQSVADVPAARRQVEVRSTWPAWLRRNGVVESRDDRESGLDGGRIRRLEGPRLIHRQVKENAYV